MKINVKNLYSEISKDRRSFLIYKSLFLSLGARIVSIMINFLLVPLTLGYLDQERYGIWLILVSIISWIYFLDIGLGDGLRNKLTESLASNNSELGRKYVSTTYFILFIIAISLMLLLFPFCFFIDWVNLLNVSHVSNVELCYTTIILLSFFSFHFFFKIIGTVYTALHKPYISLYLSLFIGLINFLSILIVKKNFTPSLIPVAFSMGISQLSVYLFATIYFYVKKLKYISPKFSFVDTSLMKSLFSMGVKFFIIQIAGVIMFSSSTFIISRVADPSYVIEYDLSNKYLSVSNYIFSFLLIPYWNAFTDAFAHKEYEWIDKKIKNLNKLWIYSVIIIIIMVIISQPLYNLWLNGKVNISFFVTLLMGLYYIFMNLSSIYNTLLNGISKINFSFTLAVVQLILFFPSVFLLHTFIKKITYAILIIMILNMFASSFLLRFQYSKIRKTL